VTIRQRIARRLRFLADRIDRRGAPKAIGWSFTFERGEGIVFWESRDKGCPLWYLGDADYEKAYTGASKHPEFRVHWRSGLVERRP
jgi:hypothetical protein